MPTSDLPDTDDTNQDLIESIAKEMHHPLPVVRRVYQEQLARLTAEARIVDYVAVLAARRTRDVLSRGGTSSS